jgi:hypothetical protein
VAAWRAVCRPAPARRPGIAGQTLNWPSGDGAEGNGGVATGVYRSLLS